LIALSIGFVLLSFPQLNFIEPRNPVCGLTFVTYNRTAIVMPLNTAWTLIKKTPDDKQLGASAPKWPSLGNFRSHSADVLNVIADFKLESEVLVAKH
jgi:hypothetical protein